MKILIIANSFPKPNNRNMGSYIFSQAKSLISAGEEVIVVSPTIFVPKALRFINKKIEGYSKIPSKYMLNGIEVYYPKITIYNNKLSLKDRLPNLIYYIYKKQIIKLVKMLLKENNIDLIYCHGPLLEGRFGIDMKKEFKIPVVIIEHSITNIKNSIKRKQNYERILNECDRFITVSKVQKKVIVDNFIVNKCIDVVLNGFELSKINVEYTTNKNNKLKLITVAFLEERKGYFTLLKALKKFKQYGNRDFIHIIIGDGSQREKIKDMINEYDLEENCIMMGILSHDKVIKEMLNSDIFVLPSYNESFGIVYLEAMNCKLPIIGTMNEGISDIIVDGENGLLINQGDVDELEKKIELLANDDKKRKKIGENGYNTAKNITWENNSLKLKQIFQEVIKNNKTN